MSVLRDIIRHTSVYGIGLAVGRAATILLLPFYTRHLTPADFGIIALFDLTTMILARTGGAGLPMAALRYHFEPRYSESRHAVWTTALAMLVVVVAPQILVGWVLRGDVAALIFGSAVVEGPLCVALAVCLLPARTLTVFCRQYLRAEKRSGLFVGIMLPGLLLRIILNVYMIAVLRMGVLGFLWGTLLAAWLELLALMAALFLGRPLRVLRELVGPMWSYGWPLILTSLSVLAMHQMNRYLLRWLMDDLGAVGIFSIAYAMAQVVEQLLMMPFQFIWGTLLFEINTRPDRREIFQRVFKGYTLVIGFVLLALAMLSVPVVRILATAEFFAAADILPVLCIAFFFYSLHPMLRMPAIIHNRTTSVAGASVLATIVSFLANVALIPSHGIHGAAVASVITYVAFSLFGHMAYRRIENLQLPLRYAVGVPLVGVALHAMVRFIVPSGATMLHHAVAGCVAWGLAAAIICIGPARQILSQGPGLRALMTRRDDEA